MNLFKSVIVLLFVVNATSSASLIDNFLSRASNFWPQKNDIVEKKEPNKLPTINFELPKESEEFIKEGLVLIDAPREALDVCTHRVIHSLKKNCNQLNLEEIGKLSVMMLNCQLEIEGRETFSCKPEMTLQQCTMGMTPEAHQAYNYMTHRAVGICSAMKQDQYRALAEITVNRLMQAAQSQVSAMNEALKTQRRLNEMGSYNFKELNENDLKMKEKQAESMEKLQHAENLIEENLVSLQQELLLRQKAEEKLSEIKESAEHISAKLELHVQELHEGHELLLDDVKEISKNMRKNNQDMLVHYEETLMFLENFKSVTAVLSQIGTTTKMLLESGLEMFPEHRLEVSQEFVSFGLFNLVYFVCGMIYMLFINAENFTKGVLIGLVAFNSVASGFKTNTPLLAINFFVWFGLCAFKSMSAVSKRFARLKFNFKMTSISRPAVRKSHDSDESEEELSVLENQQAYRSSSPWPLATPVKVKTEQISNAKRYQTMSATKKEMSRNSNNSEEDDFSLMNVAVQTSSTTVIPRNKKVPESPVSLRTALRPSTPTFERLIRESRISEPVAERSATPFLNGMIGRVQCKSLTAKGLLCRNAAVIGFSKCRVHS